MNEKHWYEHLDEEDLDGKHVQVTLIDGTVLSGRLTVREDYPDVALLSTALVQPYEDGTKADWPIGVMCQTEDPRWLPFDGVSDISLVWDERNWEQIPINKVDRFAYEEYAIVVNGHLHVISWYNEDTCSFDLDGLDCSIYEDDISFALHHKTRPQNKADSHNNCEKSYEVLERNNPEITKVIRAKTPEEAA